MNLYACLIHTLIHTNIVWFNTFWSWLLCVIWSANNALKIKETTKKNTHRKQIKWMLFAPSSSSTSNIQTNCYAIDVILLCCSCNVKDILGIGSFSCLISSFSLNAFEWSILTCSRIYFSTHAMCCCPNGLFDNKKWM